MIMKSGSLMNVNMIMKNEHVIKIVPLEKEFIVTMNYLKNETQIENPNFYEKYQHAKEKIKLLKTENENYSKTNDLLQNELQQKAHALEQSTKAYSSLKIQYEELLARLTEMRLESISYNSMNSSNSSQQQSEKGGENNVSNKDELIEQLRRKIEKKNSKIEKLRQLIQTIQQELSYDEPYDKAKPLINQLIFAEPTTQKDKKEFVTKTLDYVYTYLQNNLQLQQLLEKEKKRNKKLHKQLKNLTALVRENREKLEQHFQQEQKQNEDEVLDNEIEKLKQYAKRHYIHDSYQQNPSSLQ